MERVLLPKRVLSFRFEHPFLTLSFITPSSTERQAPQIEIHPQEPQVIRAGGQAMLSCRPIHGIPNPTTTWERIDGRPLSNRFQEQYEGTMM